MPARTTPTTTANVTCRTARTLPPKESGSSSSMGSRSSSGARSSGGAAADRSTPPACSCRTRTGPVAGPTSAAESQSSPAAVDAAHSASCSSSAPAGVSSGALPVAGAPTSTASPATPPVSAARGVSGAGDSPTGSSGAGAATGPASTSSTPSASASAVTSSTDRPGRVRRILGEPPGKDVPQPGQRPFVPDVDRPEPFDDLCPAAGGATAGQQLVGDRSHGVAVRLGAPVGADDHFRGGVGTAHRRAVADILQRARDPEAGRPGLVRRDEHIPQMQAAVQDAGVVGGVDGAREVMEQRHGALGRGGRVVAHRNIERLRGDVILGQVGNAAFAPGRQRGDDARMGQPGVDHLLEGAGELVGELRRQVEVEGLDSDGGSGLRCRGAEDRPEDTGPELMQDPKRAERTGSGRRSGVLECQWCSPPGQRADRTTEAASFQWVGRTRAGPAGP